MPARSRYSTARPAVDGVCHSGDPNGPACQFRTDALQRPVVEHVPTVARAMLAGLDVAAQLRAGHLLTANVVEADDLLELSARGPRPRARDPVETAAEFLIRKIPQAAAEDAEVRRRRAGTMLVVTERFQTLSDERDGLRPAERLGSLGRIRVTVHEHDSATGGIGTT